MLDNKIRKNLVHVVLLHVKRQPQRIKHVEMTSRGIFYNMHSVDPDWPSMESRVTSKKIIPTFRFILSYIIHNTNILLINLSYISNSSLTKY